MKPGINDILCLLFTKDQATRHDQQMVLFTYVFFSLVISHYAVVLDGATQAERCSGFSTFCIRIPIVTNYISTVEVFD